MKSCKNCKFHQTKIRKCSLTASIRQPWDCCVGHEEKKDCRPITTELLKNMGEGQKRRSGVEQFEFDGRSQTVLAWAEEYGLCRHVLRKRLNAGWEMHKALTKITTKKPRSKRSV